MKPESFLHRGLPGRVRFGAGTLDLLGEEAAELGFERALVVCTPGGEVLGRRALDALGRRAVGIHPHAVTHVPAPVARAAVEAAAAAGADSVVAVGGGSAIGLAKAMALELQLPVLAVPTTYAGSEMTPIWGLTDDGVKRTGRDPRVQPRAVVYDPELTGSLPPGVSAASAMNAIAHAVEALYATDRSPLISLMAEEGIRALARAAPAVVAKPEDLEKRGEALYGTWLCGTCLGSVSMSLHHKLCHVLGGAFDLPHAETHTVVLPYAAAYNAAAATGAMTRVARALGADDSVSAPVALQQLAWSLPVPRSLRELGLTEAEIPRAVELATRDPYPNPAAITEEGVRALLTFALRGEPVGALFQPRPSSSS